MFVGFRIINNWLYVYVANNVRAVKAFQKCKDISKRKWYFKRYGLYDYIRMPPAAPMVPLDDLINTIYDYDKLVKILSEKCNININNVNEVAEFLRAPKYQVYERILELLLTTLAESEVQQNIKRVMEEEKEREERKKSVMIVQLDNQYIIKLIERQGEALDDEEAIIYYEAKERHIFYYYWTHEAIMIPKEMPPVENFVDVLREYIKSNQSKAIRYMLEEMMKIKQFEDYAIAGLMVMD
jgi:hypothetical protein